MMWGSPYPEGCRKVATMETMNPFWHCVNKWSKVASGNVDGVWKRMVEGAVDVAREQVKETTVGRCSMCRCKGRWSGRGAVEFS